MQARPDGYLRAAGQTEPDVLCPLYIEVTGSGEGPKIPPPKRVSGAQTRRLVAGGGGRERSSDGFAASSPPN